MSSPCISVLVTAYNREDFLAEALDSVLAQSVTDIEVIISDDRSTDRTAEIAAAFARRDSRVRVSVNDRNLGDYGNRRRAASLARGRYLKYHDSDDVMYRHCLSTMLEPLEAEPRAGFALSGPRGWPGGPCPMLLTPRLSYEREYLGYGLFQQGPASALFRTEVFRELGGFPDVMNAGDYLFWLQACAKVNVLLVPGDLFYYRTHAAQELAKPTQETAQIGANAAAWRMLNSPECPLDHDTLPRAKRNFAFSRARDILRYLQGGRFDLAALAIRTLGLTPRDWATHLRLPCRSAAAGTPIRG